MLLDLGYPRGLEKIVKVWWKLLWERIVASLHVVVSDGKTGSVLSP